MYIYILKRKFSYNKNKKIRLKKKYCNLWTFASERVPFQSANDIRVNKGWRIGMREGPCCAIYLHKKRFLKERPK